MDVLLQNARKRRKKTQAQVADEIGVTQPAIAQWESGKVPESHRWPAIAEAYGVKIAAIVKAVAAELAA